MAATADLGEMTRMWAGEQYLGHWDGYSVETLATTPNNYYLHSDEAASPHRVRPRRLTLRARRGERLRVSGMLRLPTGARCGGRVAVPVDAGGRCWRCARCSCVATAGTPRASGCGGGPR